MTTKLTGGNRILLTRFSYVHCHRCFDLSHVRPLNCEFYNDAALFLVGVFWNYKKINCVQKCFFLTVPLRPNTWHVLFSVLQQQFSRQSTCSGSRRNSQFNEIPHHLVSDKQKEFDRFLSVNKAVTCKYQQASPTLYGLSHSVAPRSVFLSFSCQFRSWPDKLTKIILVAHLTSCHSIASNFQVLESKLSRLMVWETLA